MGLKKPSATSIAGAGAALVSGAGVGRWYAWREFERELAVASLTHELELTGVCANTLKLTSAQRPDKVRLALDQRVDGAFRAIAELVDDGANLKGYAVPNLRDSLRRAADYYTTQGDSARARTASGLLARLDAPR